MIDVEFTTPATYAAHLAGYISDPSTIHIRTREQFGRAPSVEECRKLREKVTAPANARKGIYTGRFPCGHDRSDANTVWLSLNHDACKQCSEAKRAQQEAMLTEKQKAQRDKRAREKVSLDHMAEERRARMASVAADRMREVGVGSAYFINELIACVAHAFLTTPEAVVSPSRWPREVCARSVISRILYERGNMSLPMIGRRLGGRDHSTVLNAINTFEKRAKAYPEMIAVYEALR